MRQCPSATIVWIKHVRMLLNCWSFCALFPPFPPSSFTLLRMLCRCACVLFRMRARYDPLMMYKAARLLSNIAARLDIPSAFETVAPCTLMAKIEIT